MMFLLYFLAFAILAADAVKYEVYPETISVNVGDGLALKVLPGGEPLQNCSVSINGATYTLDPNDNNPETVVKYWGNGQEEGDCGAKVENIQDYSYNGSWTFTFVINGKAEVARATIIIKNSNSNLSTPIVTEMGQQVVVPCDEAGAELLYCMLTNPNGDTVRSGTNCTEAIDAVKLSDVGTWLCTKGLLNGIQESISKIIISVHPIKNLEIGRNETEKEVIIFCNSYIKNITYCRFERPDGKGFIMSEGRYLGRYTYFGRGIASNDCGMTISKPMDTTDIGTWMCTLGLKGGGRSGGFLTLDSGSKGVPRDPKDYNTAQPQKVSALTGDPLTLDCSVNTGLSYCWFKHPNGTRYNPHPDFTATDWKYHGDSLLLGQCGLTILSASVKDSGTWVCGMGVQDEAQATLDLQRTFAVTVSDIPFVENRTLTTVMLGDQAVLACRSLQGEALQYCSFLAPNGTGYNLIPGQASGRLTYYGNGLEYGDCGLKINPVQSEDYGIWQCGTMLTATKNGMELIGNLQLQAPGFLSSSALGLVIGAVVAVVLVCGFVIYRHRQARQRRRESGRPMVQRSRPVAMSALSDVSDEVEVGDINVA